MFKKKRWMGILVLAFWIAGAGLLAGCGRWEPVDALLEGLTQGPKNPADPANRVKVVLQTEEELPPEEEPTEAETESTEVLLAKSLPVLVSTWADAEKVALAYQYEAGDTVTLSEVEEIGEDAFFVQMMIDDALFDRIYGKTYKADCPLPVDELRYLRLLHCDLDGKIHVGELICNRSISDDVLTIFHKLYTAGYPIEKVVLADEYENADILLSSADNNTAAFNYRHTVGKTTMSLHAQGIAIDINPLYNPYVMYQADGTYEVAPSNGEAYMDRSKDFPYKIDRNDLCYQLFTEAGFTWGGIWNSPDYMHFFRK